MCRIFVHTRSQKNYEKTLIDLNKTTMFATDITDLGNYTKESQI